MKHPAIKTPSWDDTDPVFEDTVPVGGEFDTQSSLPVIDKKTTGLFGTSLGENSPILQKARIPSEMTKMGGKLMGQSFDAQTQSVPLNMAMNLPGTVADIGSELVSSAVGPESLLMQGAASALPFLSKPVNAFGRHVGNTFESPLSFPSK